jgi:hypothetical protein
VVDVAQTEDADHPLALVDHWQPADFQCLHVPYRLGEVIGSNGCLGSSADHFFIFNAAPSKVVTMACGGAHLRR